MDHSLPERLARVETALETLTGTVTKMAGQVEEVRDHMLTSKGKSLGWRLMGSLVVGASVVASGVGAIAAVYLAH